MTTISLVDGHANSGHDALVPLPREICANPCGNKVTRRQLIMNLICGGLGTGMFSLPSSTAGSSLLPAFAMLAFMVFLNAWTIMILVEAAEQHQVFDIGALVGLMPQKALGGRLRLGALAQAFVNAMVVVVCMISLISYLIVINDSVQTFGRSSTSTSHGRVPIVTLAAIAMVPLCFLEQRYLSWSSAIALVVNIYILCVMFFLFGKVSLHNELPQDSCLLGAGRGIISMLAVLGQCFVVQMCVLPMYEELEDRSPRKFKQCLWTAFAVLAFIFGIFALLGYVTFGPSVQGNALQNLPGDATYALIAQVGTILVVSALYPIMVIPMVAPVRNMAKGYSANRRKLLVAGVVLLIVLTSYVFAIVMSDLLVVNVIGGALCVGVFASFGPGLVGLYVLRKEGSSCKVLMVALIVFGILNAVAGVIFPHNYAEELTAHCVLRIPR